MKDPFKHSDKTFIAGENRVYIGELPHQLALQDVPKDVARAGLFRLDSRDGQLLTFKTGLKYLVPCTGEVIISQETEEEICYINHKGTQILLEASHYMRGGRKVTSESLDHLHTNDGRTLREYLKDKASELREEQ